MDSSLHGYHGRGSPLSSVASTSSWVVEMQVKDYTLKGDLIFVEELDYQMHLALDPLPKKWKAQTLCRKVYYQKSPDKLSEPRLNSELCPSCVNLAKRTGFFGQD
jgi:hypothetical protein